MFLPKRIITFGVAAAMFAATSLSAQPPAQAPPRAPAGRGGGGGGGGFAAAFPQRPPADPAAVERGRAIYGVQCNFCHGSDARGGEGGPNLLRSQLVLNDQNGEAIGPVILNG